MANNDIENMDTEVRMPQTVKPSTKKNEWGLLLAFSLFAFVTQIGYVHLPSIVDKAAQYFKCSSQNIMTFSNIFPLFSCLLGWLPLVVLRLRFDRTVIFCSLICTIGFWIVYAATSNYNIALLGHLFLSFSNVFNLSPAIYIAEQYFSPEKKALAISIPYYFSLFGTNFGYICSTNMISHHTITDINLVYAVVGSLQLLLCLYSIWRVSKRTANSQDNMENQYSLAKEILILKSKPSAFLSTLILSIFNGIGSAITTLIAFMFMTVSTEYSLTDKQIGIAALIYNSAGAVFGMTISKIIERRSTEQQRQKSIRGFFRILYILSSLSSILFAAYCNYVSIEFLSLCLILFFLGGSLNGSYSVILQFLTHKYGLSELLISNLFNMSSSFISYIVILYMSTKRTSRVGTCLLAFVIVVCSCYLKLLYFRNEQLEEQRNLTEQPQENMQVDFPPKSSMIQTEEINKQ